VRTNGDKIVDDEYSIINKDNEKKVLLPKNSKRSTGIPFKDLFSKNIKLSFIISLLFYNKPNIIGKWV